MKKSSFLVRLYALHIVCLYAIFLIAYFDKCFFLDRFPCFFKGTNCINDTLNYIFKNVPTFNCSLIPQHVILFNLYIYFCGSFSCIFLFVLSDFTLMSKCI